VKQDGYNYLASYDLTPGALGGQPSFVIDRWRDPGNNTDIQRFTTTLFQTEYTRFIGSDQSITNASFIRLKNLSLSYTLPQKWSAKCQLANARVFIQGQNLLTFTTYKGLDPESQGSRLPPLKISTIGVSLSF
jgi:hypothetical protein